jgi:hypothetical protein
MQTCFFPLLVLCTAAAAVAVQQEALQELLTSKPCITEYKESITTNSCYPEAEQSSTASD